MLNSAAASIVVQTEPPLQAHSTQSAHSAQALPSHSPEDRAGRSLSDGVDTGFLRVYGPENQLNAEQQEFEASLGTMHNFSDSPQQELQQSYAETYWDYCYPWCPVLDKVTLIGDLARSPLLANALALAASHIQPPLVPHDGPAAYYDKARKLLYSDEEPSPIATLRAISLFYWWAPRPPTTANRHSSWWWTSVVIRHAQQMNIHHEPGPASSLTDPLLLSLRRRIWWTAFVSHPNV